jgi:hypothetical protein
MAAVTLWNFTHQNRPPEHRRARHLMCVLFQIPHSGRVTPSW